MRRRYPAEQSLEWITGRAESGQTIADFCDSIGVSEKSFYVCRRKLRWQVTDLLPLGSNGEYGEDGQATSADDPDLVPSPFSNDPAKGFNSRTESIKSAARGFRIFDNYRARTLFFCGKLTLVPDTGHDTL